MTRHSTANWVAQSMAAQAHRRKELTRLRGDGWVVMEHTEADASVYRPPVEKTP